MDYPLIEKNSNEKFQVKSRKSFLWNAKLSSVSKDLTLWTITNKNELGRDPKNASKVKFGMVIDKIERRDYEIDDLIGNLKNSIDGAREHLSGTKLLMVGRIHGPYLTGLRLIFLNRDKSLFHPDHFVYP